MGNDTNNWRSSMRQQRCEFSDFQSEANQGRIVILKEEGKAEQYGNQNVIEMHDTHGVIWRHSPFSIGKPYVAFRRKVSILP